MQIENISPEHSLTGLIEHQLNTLEHYRWLSETYHFSLIPLHPGSKVPVENDWPQWCVKNRKFDAKDFVCKSATGEIQVLNAGVATGPGSGVIVVDIDDAEGFTKWTQERDIKDPLPDTFAVKSGGKYYHYYYRYPKTEIEYRKKNVKGIFDVLAIGAQAVAPGSIHPQTQNVYTIANQHEFAEPPQWLLNLSINGDTMHPKVVKETSDKIPHSIETFVKAPSEDPILQGERNSRLTSLAGVMRRKGMSQQGIEAALLKENTIRCQPPLDESEIHSISASICRYKPKYDQNKFPLTEVGNAERLVASFEHDILYCQQQKKWFIWNEGIWVHDNKGKLATFAKTVLRQMQQEALTLSDRESKRKLIAHALKSESAFGIRNMIDLAQSDPKISVSLDEFDKDPFLLNCINGTLQLQDGTFHPHERKHRLTHMIQVEYDLYAKCPKFTKFIDDIMGHNANLIKYLQTIIGYCLTGDTSEQCYFIFLGTGSNGKTTLLNVLRALMGALCKNIDFTTLSYSGYSARNDLARLIGARLVTSVEVQSRSCVNESVVNRITGCDPITVKFLYSEPFEYIPKYKLIVAGNEKPNIEGLSHATWRRIRLIPFNVRFDDSNGINKNLYHELIEELPGILTWALEGCLRWQQEGLVTPTEVVTATLEYMAEKDTVGAFLKECCIVDPQGAIKSSDIYDNYVKWCDNNEQSKMGKKNFSKMLNDKGFVKEKFSGNKYWKGLSFPSVAQHLNQAMNAFMDNVT